MSFFKDLKVGYEAGRIEAYSGRKSELNNQYWHQEIEAAHIEDINSKKNINIGLVGYVCDEGVRRNQGRIGARKGPKSIRNKLGKLPIHHTGKKIIDFGDVICLDTYLEDCQKALSKTISKLIKHNVLPIAIGGGHDIAYRQF